MKVRFNRWYNAVLTVLLSMLGIGCSSDEPVDIEEYGCPYADYVVDGTVTDEAGTPIQGIRVTAPNSSTDSQAYQSVETDAAGGFKLNEFSSMMGGDIFIEDIDGEANGGKFQSETISVWSLPKTQIEEGERWYEGKFSVTANIKLKKI